MWIDRSSGSPGGLPLSLCGGSGQGEPVNQTCQFWRAAPRSFPPAPKALAQRPLQTKPTKAVPATGRPWLVKSVWPLRAV